MSYTSVGHGFIRSAAAPLLCAALVACGSSSGVFDPGSVVRGDALVKASATCVSKINGYRQQVGVSPLLTQWSSEESCGDSQAKSDSRSGTAHGAFGKCGEGAQNECPGWGSLDDILNGCLQAMFNEGPGEPYSAHGHYINMTNPGYSQVACGFYQTSDGKWWAVQDFK